jgi:hypothetical protein
MDCCRRSSRRWVCLAQTSCQQSLSFQPDRADWQDTIVKERGGGGRPVCRSARSVSAGPIMDITRRGARQDAVGAEQGDEHRDSGARRLGDAERE